MAIFRGTALYMRATDQDQAWGTNVRALLGTAGADTNFTVTFTSTTAATQTVNPYTNISNVTADNRTNLGWALNEADASTDSMGATSSRKRIIHAGTWSFGFAWTSNAPALLASYTVTIEYSVYRVATGGGTRTLLFTVSAAPVTVSLVAGSGDGAVTSSQPEYLIEPGETIHVAVRITSAATSSVLGGTTNTVITCTGATSGSFTTTLPTPGLRNLTFDSNSSTGAGSGTKLLLTQKDTITATGAGSGTVAKLADYFRAYTSTGSGTGTRALLVVFTSLSATASAVSNKSLLLQKDTITATGAGSGTKLLLTQKDTITATGAGSGTISRALELFRSFTSNAAASSTRTLTASKDTITATGAGSGTISRALELFRSFTATGSGSGTRATLIIKDITSAVAVGDLTFIRSVIFVRTFAATGTGVGDIFKAVIFVRGFNSTASAQVKPRIALDWDDLPDAGTSTVINYYRPLFVFDD